MRSPGAAVLARIQGTRRSSEYFPAVGLPVADGSRANPLYDQAIELYFGGVPGSSYGGISVNPNGTGGCGSLPTGAGIAIRLYAPGAPGGLSGNNYSAGVNLACPGSTSFVYSLSIPVSDQTAPTEHVQLQFWANVSTNGQPVPRQLAIDGCRLSYNFTVGMLNGTPLLTGGPPAPFKALWGNPHTTCSNVQGAITRTWFSWSAVPIGEKTTTYLWVPDDNSTLSQAPWGLKQYVGEQSFALVVVNNVGSSTQQSAQVPLPWGGNESGLSATPGLTNFLVPRDEYLASVLGTALSNETVPNATAVYGPLLSAATGGAVVNGGAAATLAQLGCYWQNRAVSANPWLCGSSRSGTAANTTYAMSADLATSCASTNCGSLPLNPLAENLSDSGAAVGSVITLNLSDASGTPSEVFDALIASLIDNSSGGVNGTFVSITTAIGGLGISPTVVRGIANVTYSSGGLFGLPSSRAQPPPTPCHSICLLSLVNAAIATVVVLGTLVGLPSSAIGPLTFLVLIEAFLTVYLASEIASRTVSLLSSAANLIRDGFDELMSGMITLAKAMLNDLFAPFILARDVYIGTLLLNSQNASANESANGSFDEALAAAIWNGLAGTLYILGLLVGIGVEVVLGLLTMITAGAAGMTLGAIVGILLMTVAAIAIGFLSSALDTTMVGAVESLAGTRADQTPNKSEWAVASGAFQWYASGFTGTAAVYMGYRISPPDP